MEIFEKLENGFNTGVQIPIVKPTDSVAGGESYVLYEERIKDGDWEKYKPTDEWQRRLANNLLGFDTNSCVTFSALNIVEAQIYFLIKTGAFSDEQIAKLTELGCLDENGRPNFNDWFSSIMDGTTDNGNQIMAPWDSFRKHGLLPQKDGYSVNDFTSREEWFAAKPTQEQKDKALKIKEIIDITYEWVICDASGGNIEVMKKHLKQAPLHILTPTGSNWNTQPPKIIADPGVKTVNHATSCFAVTDTFVKDVDHYNPFIKNLALNYYIPYVVKGVVSVKKFENEEINVYFGRNLSIGMSGDDVSLLQKILKIEVPDMFKLAPTGYYGSITAKAVSALQEKYASEILTPLKLTKGTGNFYQSTREFINKKYA